jgi:hypothetical protein
MSYFRCQYCRNTHEGIASYILHVYHLDSNKNNLNHICKKCYDYHFGINQEKIEWCDHTDCMHCNEPLAFCNNIAIDKYNETYSRSVNWMWFHAECFYDLCSASFAEDHLYDL